MKFLLDAQLPKKLCNFFEQRGYDALHTLDLPDKNRTKDSQINQISIEQKRVLITKDMDFIESLLVSDKPFKLIYVATGNITNNDLLNLFDKNLKEVLRAIGNNRLIELTHNSIIIRM